MGMITVNPGALRSYADWVRPKVLRVDTAAYDSAIQAYLSAGNNDFGSGGVTNTTSEVDVDLAAAERHNLVAESFADAVESLDSDYATNRDGNVTFNLDHGHFMAMKAYWATLGDDEDLVEQAEDIQAEQYADDVNAVLADDDLDSEQKRAEVERLLTEMEADGIADDPSAQEAFVLTLGAEGLNELNEAATVAEAQGSGSWLPVLTQMSGYVATTANRLSDAQLREFVGGLESSVLFMNARMTPWGNDATTVAVEGLWGDGDWPMSVARWPASFVATMGQGDSRANWDALPDTTRAAAAGLLADNPEVAHEFLTATDDQGRQRLTDMVYNVDHAFAGDALVAGLQTSPGTFLDTVPGPGGWPVGGEGSVAFQQAFAETEDTFAWLVNHHETTDGRWTFEDNMNDHSRVALAHVGGLFLNDLTNVAQTEGGGPGAFADVSRDDVVMFYNQLYDSTQAQQITATQLGTYTGVTWNETVNGFRNDPKSPGLQNMGGVTLQIDYLSDIFTDALEADTDDAAERANFWVGVGEATGSTISTLLIAATPLTAGASTVAGAAAGWGISELSEAVPIPEFDATAHAVGERQQANQTAIQVLIQHPDVLDEFYDPSSGRTAYNLPQETIDMLQGDEIWKNLRSSDDVTRIEAIATITQITYDNPLFGDAVADLTGELRWSNEGD